MKRLLLFICITVLLGLIQSCGKNEITGPEQFPDWLQQKITELIPDQKLCEMTEVTVIHYKGNTYYHVYCMIWSCMYCHLYDEQGNRPEWDTKKWDDFLAGMEVVRKVPACKK